MFGPALLDSSLLWVGFCGFSQPEMEASLSFSSPAKERNDEAIGQFDLASGEGWRCEAISEAKEEDEEGHVSRVPDYIRRMTELAARQKLTDRQKSLRTQVMMAGRWFAIVRA